MLSLTLEKQQNLWRIYIYIYTDLKISVYMYIQEKEKMGKDVAKTSWLVLADIIG